MLGPSCLRGGILIMANAFKGQVSITHEDQRYTLTLDFNALADFEGETGKDPLAVLEAYEDTGKIAMVDLRALFWAALIQDHPDLSIRDAGRIMSANPTALQQALAAVQVEQADAASGKTKAQGKARAKPKARAS